MWVAINAAVSAFDIYIIASFYHRRLQKQTSVLVIVLYTSVCAIGHYMMHYFELPVLWASITSVVICIILTFVYKATWKQRLFYPLIITALEIIAEIAAGLLLGGLCDMAVSEITANPHTTEYLIGNVTSKLIFFIIIRVLCRLHVMNDSTLPLRHWFLIMTVPVTSTAVCFGLAFSSVDYIIKNPIAPFLILLGMLGINTLAFIMYDELSAQSRDLIEHERAKYHLESDLRQYNAVVSQSKEFASLLHDTRKHRQTVHDLLAAGDSSAALRYMAGLLTPGNFLYHDTIDKNNPAVNTILSRKISEAEQSGIKVTCHYEVKSVLPVDEVRLCLILGNALDNAIEACKELPDDRDKLIEIDVQYQNSRLTIRIANTSNPVEIINNACATTKRNHMQHGYGLPNIQKAVAENGGNSVIRYDDGLFILSVMFLL